MSRLSELQSEFQPFAFELGGDAVLGNPSVVLVAFGCETSADGEVLEASRSTSSPPTPSCCPSFS